MAKQFTSEELEGIKRLEQYLLQDADPKYVSRHLRRASFNITQLALRLPCDEYSPEEIQHDSYILHRLAEVLEPIIDTED